MFIFTYLILFIYLLPLLLCCLDLCTGSEFLPDSQPGALSHSIPTYPLLGLLCLTHTVLHNQGYLQRLYLLLGIMVITSGLRFREKTPGPGIRGYKVLTGKHTSRTHFQDYLAGIENMKNKSQELKLIYKPETRASATR